MWSYFLKCCSVVCGLLVFNTATAQEAEKPESGYGIEANALFGKVVKHTIKFHAPIPALSSAVDVNFLCKTNGRKDWQKRRNYPQVGVGMTYTGYGNNDVFGHCIAIYPNLQIPLFHSERLDWTLRIGDGVGYVTRKYQTAAPVDTLNNAIGSHINDFGIFMMDLRYHVNDHWHAQVGINLTHISNGGTEQPNLGVNMVGAHAGVLYYPGTYRPKPVNRPVCWLNNRWLFHVQTDVSFKQARALGMPILPSFMPSIYMSRRWHCKNKYFFGVDGTFHNDVWAFMRYYDVNSGKQRQQSWDGYVFAGNEFLFGRVGIITQLGVNYKSTFLKFDPYCEKIGGNFYFVQQEKGTVKEVYFNAMLLAHAAIAELVQFGLGFGF